MRTVPIRGVEPRVDASAWIAPGATLVGDVVVHARASVFYGAVLRADGARIEIGPESNVQDNVVMHVDRGTPLTLGARVSVGHTAVLHGCTVGDDALIGMGAIVMARAEIGAESLVAAGALVLEGTVAPPGSLVAGSPATVRRPLRDDERAALRQNATVYLALVADNRGDTVV